MTLIDRGVAPPMLAADRLRTGKLARGRRLARPGKALGRAG